MRDGMRYAVLFLAVVVLLSGIGCSTIYHWERVGNPESNQGKLDVGMLVLDICYVPLFGAGIVALLVDFLTGTIYVPKNQGH